MDYGPGASVKIWKALLGPLAEIWSADYDKECVNKSSKEGKLEGIHVLTGDQGDSAVVKRYKQICLPHSLRTQYH